MNKYLHFVTNVGISIKQGVGHGLASINNNGLGK